MQRVQTDAAILFKMVYEGMRRAGFPVEEIFARAGVALSRVDDKARTPNHMQVAFWKAAESVTNDPDLGLHLAEHMPLYRGQVVEYLFLSSASFGAGLRRALAYQRLVSDVLEASIHITDDQVFLSNTTSFYTDTLSLRHFSECFTASMLRFFRFVTDGNFNFTRIDFAFANGASPEEYQRIFGCPVHLGQSETRVYFDLKIMDQPLWQSEPELLRLHEQLALEKLQELVRSDLVSDVRRAIGETLESGEVSLDTIAERLNISSRRLRTQLSEAETSFQQVLSDYRMRLAKRLLSKTNESVERIVYLTGFSEPSTFYRAFRRWTDETPVEYRKRKQNDALVS
jgi:AraC-like DNA-binding protein